MRAFLTLALLAGAAMPAAAATRTFPIGGFDRVESAGPFDVRVHVGGAPSARADGPQEVLDRLKVEVRNGTLWIGTKPGNWSFGWHWFGHTGRTVIDVVAPALTGSSVSGPGNMSVDHVRARAFEASVSGPGDLRIGMLETVEAHLSVGGPGTITLAGHASRSRMNVSGPGNIHGKDFVSLDLDLNVSGPGGITTNAAHNATGNVSGPGDVDIAGHPRCSIEKSGPGSVRCG
ncbi:hypothetical protein FHS31_003149 [Sphingomonas vulcanisoli]|uniref:Putative auto-transporter adhesin head GIN domain-containing protein n=1 Tax=Sphingomonas vulcanisoli TaxID=1658060 RepID=A0ABX0TVQ7_9SPHN|nr:head GIN domain-containing protein [Sphingomonas vulcanisoli]NIJ09516.1 hypothetical protein [Sphingomonas vulcanisoli]